MKYFFALTAFVLLVSCTPQKEYQNEGEALDDKGALTTEVFLSQVDTAKKTYKVKAVVEEVCQMKGCWMTLRNEDNLNVRVTFKDYGFFVPKDISGKEVIIEGVGYKEILDDETARHFAEDANKEYSESDREQISFVAQGVLIEKEAS